MNPTNSNRATRAFTLTELLVVVAIILVLFAMLLPVNREHERPTTMVCLSNLKQMNIGFILYLSDHGNQFPWQVSTNKGGTAELISSGLASDHFSKLSGYSVQPKAFVCPSDTTRRVATSYAGFSNTNLSYFIALDAVTNNLYGMLLGDRHLQIGRQLLKPGLHSMTTNDVPGWTTELHWNKNSSNRGNLAFTDGHAELVKTHKLPEYFQRQSLATNRLVIP